MTDVQLVCFHTFTTQVTTDNIVMWVTRLSIVDRVYSKTENCAGDLEGSKSTREGVLCIFGSRTIVTVSWMRKKTNVSIKQFYIIRNHLVLDYARMDGLLAPDLRDVVIEVLHSSKSTE